MDVLQRARDISGFTADTQVGFAVDQLPQAVTSHWMIIHNEYSLFLHGFVPLQELTGMTSSTAFSFKCQQTLRDGPPNRKTELSELAGATSPRTSILEREW